LGYQWYFVGIVGEFGVLRPIDGFNHLQMGHSLE
jgi:hypothetical protein